MNMTGPQPTSLHLHTLESLCVELVSGRSISIDNQGNTFQLASNESRAIFDWYTKNRGKWGSQVLKADLDSIADQLKQAPPNPSVATASSTAANCRPVHIKSLRAHRFAGIHRYEEPGKSPDVFKLDFTNKITLIEGQNGSGKTSILNALLWCLTGYVFLSQQEPKFVSNLFDISTQDISGSENITKQIAAVVPLPSSSVLSALGSTPLPLDTWVEVSLVDDSGADLGTFRRSIERTTKGKLQINLPNFGVIGFDPISLELGTRILGLIPYIQLGEISDLGSALSALTGLRPLQDLAKHAKRAADRLKNELPREMRAEISILNTEFNQNRQSFAELLARNPHIKDIPAISAMDDNSAIEVILKCKERIDILSASALAQSKAILGDSFDSNDPNSRTNLIESVGKAMGCLDLKTISSVESSRRLSELGQLSATEIQQAKKLLSRLQEEANQIADLDAKPDIAKRIRLYSRIAAWMREVSEHDIDHCPICTTSLEGKIDEFTSESVQSHLKTLLVTNSEHLQQTVTAWQNSAINQLSQLPTALSIERLRDLPSSPINLITKALAEEMVAPEAFQKSLSPLKSAIQELCEKHLKELPPFEEPVSIELPNLFGEKGGKVGIAINRVARALAFAEWRQRYNSECKKAFFQIVGSPNQKTLKDLATAPVFDRLQSLQIIVQNNEPLISANKIIGLLANIHGRYLRKLFRIEEYEKTSDELSSIANLDTLVGRQVDQLLGLLHTSAKTWKNKLYQPSFIGAPEFAKTTVEANGTLDLKVQASGTFAPGAHIINGSDLRATLMAVVFAFWQYLRESRTSLSLMLFDDIQELFDEPNKRRVAETLSHMCEKGMRAILTTNDTRFLRTVTQSASAILGESSVSRFTIHTINGIRNCLELGPFREEVELKRQEFLKPANENVPGPARDYVRFVRIYCENRLVDFFDIPTSSITAKSTLSDFVNATRARLTSGMEPFTSTAFRELCSDHALANGSTFLGLMNTSHHGNESSITFMDVNNAKEDCYRICKLIDDAHEQFARHLRRDPAPKVPARPKPPAAIKFVPKEISVFDKLAAFTASTKAETVEKISEKWNCSELTNHSMYYLRTQNFGFSAKRGHRAIVDLREGQALDKSLVIALSGNRIYARRLLISKDHVSIITLASEAENPLRRPPTLMLPAAEVTLLRVVGILFDDRPYHDNSTEEAFNISTEDFLNRVEVVWRASGSSAEPLALAGQLILGGRTIPLSDLESHRDKMVAISTMNNGDALKRIGRTVPGNKHLWQLESIGGLGESTVVSVGGLTKEFKDVPQLVSVREVLGVLYEFNNS